MSFQVSAAQSKPKRSRPTTDYVPSPWGDRFINYDSEDTITMARREKEIAGLKEVVLMEVLAASADVFEQLKLIDAIDCLGVAYHFETDIEEALERIYAATYQSHDDDDGDDDDDDGDLYNVSLRFRVLRQHGYNVSTEMFNKFRDDKGNFKESLITDIPSILSLYEAAHLGVHGEDILEEALAFTAAHLIALVKNPNLAAQVTHALKQLPHKGIPRLEAKKYISIYQDMATHNQALLKLAKLDFNLLQSLHKKELSILARWWKDLGFATKLTFARDRLVECYFWSVATYFEPQYQLGRRIVTKVIAITVIIDDIYDAYGTIDELTLFTEAIQRWDIHCMNQLSEKLQLCYKALIEFFEEIEDEMAKEGRSYRVHYAKEAMKALCRGYLKEAQWFNADYIASVEEHMELALVTCTYPMLLTLSFVGMGDIVTKETFEWMSDGPKILTASSTISRFMDDIVGHKFEQKRGHAASGVECYMKQYGVSEKEAYDVLQSRVDNAWKDINSQLLKPTEMPIPILMPILNFARVMDVLYKVEDSFTHVAQPVKDGISSLLIDPVQI